MIGSAGEDVLWGFHLESIENQPLDWYTLLCHPGNRCDSAPNCESALAAIAGLNDC
jgi:hypothetical protein